MIEQASGRIVGAQLLSKANILEKINLLAFAIEQRGNDGGVDPKDFFFHPRFTNVIDETFLWSGSDADET